MTNEEYVDRCMTALFLQSNIMKASRKNPHVQTPLHAVIEENLIAAYRRHLEKFEA